MIVKKKDKKWMISSKKGNIFYCPPNFLKCKGAWRENLIKLAEKISQNKNNYIDHIIEFESKYNPRKRITMNNPSIEELKQSKTVIKILESCKLIFNDICMLYDSDLVRLIGFEATNEDCYYIVKEKTGKIMYCSAVGHLYSLKTVLSKEQYNRLESNFEINKCPKENTFIEQYRNDMNFSIKND